MNTADDDVPDDLGLAAVAPDLSDALETRRIETRVAAALFGDRPQNPKLGRYVVIDKLGEGASGTVYACYDPQLDRKVAVKLMHVDRVSPGLRARMVREARAMAKLSHPNVLHVYEVGEVDGQVYLAMEWVPGRNLGEWMNERPRKWSESFTLLLAAARGLAAAHAQGLTHRDLKPDNILIGSDGIARIIDFGLVRVIGDHESVRESSSGARSDPRLTHQGAIVGTPAYMAPEQVENSEGGPAADQFALCATFWEALHGVRAFPADGDGVGRDGRIARSRVGGGVPRWLERILERGLSAEPGARWPSVELLIAELERRRAWASRRIVTGVVAGVGLLGASLAVGPYLRRQAVLAECEEHGASAVRLWDAEASDAVRSGIAASGEVYATRAAEDVIQDFGERMLDMRRAATEVCLHDRLHASWDDITVDRARWCVEERGIELAGLAAALVDATELAVSSAPAEIDGFLWPSKCLDPVRLSGMPAPAPALREEIHDIARLRWQLWRDGVPMQAGDRYVAAIVRADAVGWAPLRADLRDAHAGLLAMSGSVDAAYEEALAAYFIAAEAGVWLSAADAALTLATILGTHERRPDEALVWAEHARLALVLADDTEGIREANRQAKLAMIYRVRGDGRSALVHQLRAVELEETLLSPDNPATETGLGLLAVAYRSAGLLDASIETGMRALERATRLSGPDSDSAVSAKTQLGLSYDAAGESAAAVQSCTEAMVGTQALLGPEHALTLLNRDRWLRIVGKYVEPRSAARGYEALLPIAERVVGPKSPRLAVMLEHHAAVLLELGALARAEQQLARARAIRGANADSDADIASTLGALAELADVRGDLARAMEHHAQALAICRERGKRAPTCAPEVRERMAASLHRAGELPRAADELRLAVAAREAYEPDGVRLAHAAAELGDVVAELGDEMTARHWLERGVAIFRSRRGFDQQEYDAAFALARLIGEMGDDMPRARRLAKQAEAGYAAAGPRYTQPRARVQQWLATHGVSARGSTSSRP